MANKKQPEGSSLLIALIVMGVLMMMSLAVSNLLIGIIKDGRILTEKTQALYAAESGIEHAIKAITDNPPGFEEKKKDALKDGIEYEYDLRATASEVPQKNADEIQFEEDRFADLRLNEAITIPLFKGTKPEDAVKNFRLDYYIAPDINLHGGKIDNDLDILRIKIFGIANDSVMEVINEFLPANQGNSAETPTCFGTSPPCYNVAKFYERVSGSDGTQEFNVSQHYPIATFMENHKQNFLVITNIINIDLISAGALSLNEKKKLANIRYRLVQENVDGQPKITLPNIKISADGFSNGTKQSVDISWPREKSLPVFNYALYRTAE